MVERLEYPRLVVPQIDEARDGPRSSKGSPSEDRTGQSQLERVTRERDILGKAVAYFSASESRNG